MRVGLKLLITALVTLIMLSCAPKHSEIVLADFDGNLITLGEFEKAYAKNAGGVEAAKEDSLQEYQKFLDLYVIYKMKLRDAFVRDYKNDEDLINELNDYKEKVGISYIEEKQIVVPGLKRFYDQRSEEVRVSHVMLKKQPNPEESLEKIEGILDSIKQGASFEDMVIKYSEDNFSKTTGGDIYWFTAGQIVPAFEYAAYETPVGEIYPKIVETKFGYHILKITDKEKRRYKLRAKHILVKVEEVRRNVADALPGEKPLDKITRIREEIVAGADFDSLARKYSDDPGSGAKGGDLGFFERRQMVKPFDEAVFDLEIGELSEIVKSRFGFHIIQLVEVMEYPPYEDELETIREMYKKSRYDYDYDRYVESLKYGFQYKLNDDVIDIISSDKNGITLTPEYRNDSLYSSNKDKVLITLNNDSYNIADLFTYLETQPKYENKELKKSLLTKGVKDYSKNILLSKKALELETTDSEFASLMNDYQNGIYIFKLQEDEIWNRVQIDSAKLRENYNKSKNDFVVKGKVNFSEIYTKEEDSINVYYQKLLDGSTFDTLASTYTERNGFKAKSGLHGLKDADDSELSKRAYSLSNDGDFSEPFEVDGGWAIVKRNNKIAERIKTFEEALPELSSSFQESESKRLEDKYINGLKDFYNPEYNYDELENAYQPEEK
ncbi:MAG: peptidylprolyl isomerase [Melioribacteraceae bacterium]|nr:peptidylprolyl isomerase [Melioribacteraceae bacterium]